MAGYQGANKKRQYDNENNVASARSGGDIKVQLRADECLLAIKKDFI